VYSERNIDINNKIIGRVDATKYGSNSSNTSDVDFQCELVDVKRYVKMMNPRPPAEIRGDITRVLERYNFDVTEL